MALHPPHADPVRKTKPAHRHGPAFDLLQFRITATRRDGPDHSPSALRRIRSAVPQSRLMVLARGTYADADAHRLAKRLLRYCDSLFTFLDHPDVPYENNRAERMIRPAVIIRKNSQSNRSDKGAMTQALLMSIYRTLTLRGHDPLETVAAALRTYTATGHLPPLPIQFVADG